MRLRWWARGGTPSLRTRLLAGVMIPSTLVLVVGAVFGVRLVTDAVQLDQLSEANTIGTSQGSTFFPSLISERAASLFYLAEPTPQNRTALDAARKDVDSNLQTLAATVKQIYALIPPQARGDETFGKLLAGLPDLRAKVDARTVQREETFSTYNQITDWLVIGNNQKAGYAPSGPSGGRVNRSGDLNRIGDLVDRSTSLLTAGLLAGDLSRPEYDDFVTAAGAFRGGLTVLTPQLDAAQQQQLAAMQSSPDWQQVSALWDSVIGRGFSDGIARSVPAPQLAQASTAAHNVAVQLLLMGFQNTDADSHINAAEAQDTLRTSVLTAVLLLAGLIVAFVVALVVTARLVRRLTKLRRETLEMADTSLPLTITRVRKGDRIDLDQEMPTLDHGRDEIGQVAAAFNKAQRYAVEAAVEESHTREGFNAAFLNIARRSQAILHQQMQVLDKIERTEPDPDRLEMLFSLDHLATRERRNAENLIILGGEQPRRQWRNPVALGELVRAAVGESEHYQRVTVGSLPHVMVDGGAVGDLVHLIAELVDNATAFSPPAAPIEVHGTVVGRGVVIEVEDQGLGIEDDQLAQLNEMLRNPPDFGLFTLSRDSRIGLFVVARLARRHLVKVTLRASAFGGIRAGLLIPTTALAGDSVPNDTSSWQLAGGGNGTDRSLPARVGAAALPSRSRTVPFNGNGNGSGYAEIEAADQYPDQYADQSGDTYPDQYAEQYPDQYPVSPVRVPAWVSQEEPRVLAPLPGRRPSPGHRPEVEYDGSARDDDELPRLPRRTRQAHMDARLLAQAAPEPEPDPDTDLFAPPNYSPETARNRMSALRRGAAQARIQDIGAEDRTEGTRW